MSQDPGEDDAARGPLPGRDRHGDAGPLRPPGRRRLPRHRRAGRPISPAAALPVNNPLAPRRRTSPRAKHLIHIYLNGGPSQVDTFDPKPLLKRYEGKTLPQGNLTTERKTGPRWPSPFTFQKYGESGIEVSEIFAGRPGTSTTSA